MLLMPIPEYIGFIKYTGKPLEQGYLDTRRSAQALLGFDEALRHFVGKQNRELAKVDYEIPVQVTTGSWVALIPYCIVVGLSIAASSYMSNAAKKMAENDFKNIGLEPIFKKTIRAIQWVLRIGKHTGSVSKKTFKDIRWRNGNKEIGIPNKDGEHLFVPVIYFDFYSETPPHLLRKIASIVTEDINLEVGVREKNKDEVESLDISNKSIFCPDVEELLFPELKHGQEVELEGLVTRGNENSNSIGFQYQGHILTCYPKEGSVVRFKPALFVKSKINGVITREGKFGEINEPKPKIIFDDLIPLEEDGSKDSQLDLFDDDSE